MPNKESSHYTRPQESRARACEKGLHGVTPVSAADGTGTGMPLLARARRLSRVNLTLDPT